MENPIGPWIEYSELIVSVMQIIAAGLTLGLLVYLGFALLLPERFQ